MEDKKLETKLSAIKFDINNEEDDFEIEFDDLDYEDLSAEEAKKISDKMLEESIKLREDIVYIEREDLIELNYIELRSPDDGDESLLKKKIKELINNGNYTREEFIEYLDGDNEQARKMINTYPKKKDFKMEEFIVWVNFLGYDLRIVPDKNRIKLGELKQNKRDEELIVFDNDPDFVPVKQMLVELINKSGLKIKNIKHFFSDKPSDSYNIIERFKKNKTMTTDTFALWLTLIGYEVELVMRNEDE